MDYEPTAGNPTCRLTDVVGFYRDIMAVNLPRVSSSTVALYINRNDIRLDKVP